MSLLIALILTAISGLGIFALMAWVAMSEAKVMERCRRVALLLASIPCTSATIWLVSHQLEEYIESPCATPNVQIEGLRAFAQSLSNAGLGMSPMT